MEKRMLPLFIFAVLICQINLSAQRQNNIYIQFWNKNSPLTTNFERYIWKDKEDTWKIYGRIGFGTFQKNEVVATKRVGGTQQFDSGNWVFDILLSLLLDPQTTLVRTQTLNAKSLFLGGNFLVGSKRDNFEFGLNFRYDRVAEHLDAWENLPEQNKLYSKLNLLPSIAYRRSSGNFLFRAGFELAGGYGTENAAFLPFLSVGFGF